MFELMYKTPLSWAEGVVAAMDDFLPDHAAGDGEVLLQVSDFKDRRRGGHAAVSCLLLSSTLLPAFSSSQQSAV